MFKRFSLQENSFQKYFKEAPGDEGDNVSVTVAPRKNRGADYTDDTNNVTVTPRANRGDDYAQDDTDDDAGAANNAAPDTEENNPPTDDTANDTPPAEPDLGDDDGTDYNADDDTGDETGADDTAADDAGGDDATGDEGGGDDVPDEPDMGDDDGTDYSAEGDDAGGDEGGDDTTDDNNESPEDLEEKNRKFNMYKKFVKLYESIFTIEDKLKSIVKDDPNENAVIKKVIANLDNAFDNLHDYMVYKYKTSTYIQIKIYYEYVITLIKLNYELLQNNKIFINK